MNKKWNYYGIFFTDKQKASLAKKAQNIITDLGFMPIPADWTTYCDHMTIVYNNKSKEREAFAKALEEQVGQEYNLHINSIGISGKAIAFGIDNFTTQNRQAHITAFVAPGANPIDSNNISDWKTLPKGFSIKGKLNVIFKNK